MSDGNKGKNLWLLLSREVLSQVLSFLGGKENMVLNQSMTNRQSREALVEAYKSTVIKGWEFPNTLEAARYEDADRNPEDLFDGLVWCLERGIDAREFRVIIPGEDARHHLSWLFNMNRRGMLREIFSRCVQSYDFNFQSYEGFTILMRCVIGGHTDLVKLLCANENVDVNRVTESNRSAVMIAVSRKRHAELRILLERGKAFPDHATTSSMTPLLKAVERGDEVSVALLLEYGADPNTFRNSEGAVDLALTNIRVGNHSMQIMNRIIKLLVKHGGMPQWRRAAQVDPGGRETA